MKASKALVLSAVFLLCGLVLFTVAEVAVGAEREVQRERGLLDLSQEYIEATGNAVAPKGMSGPQARLLARRGAMADLQRNMLEFLVGARIDARTTMDDFMADDRVRSEVNGAIRGVEVLKGEWDGEVYTVTGRMKLAPIILIIEKYR